MTTSSNDEIRSIDQIIDLPYSELNDAEIDSLIQYKADIQTRDALHSEKMKAINDMVEENIKITQEVANVATSRLNKLTELALTRLENAINEQTQ